MRKFFTLLWLLFTVGATVYCIERGPDQLRRIDAYRLYTNIQSLERVDKPDWQAIVKLYDRLAVLLPPDENHLLKYKIELAGCRARLEALQLQEAIARLQRLLDKVSVEYGDNAQITRAVRETMGRAQFMAGKVLQEIGAPEQQWKSRYARSRQIFRYLAEHDNPRAYAKYQSRITRATVQMRTAGRTTGGEVQ